MRRLNHPRCGMTIIELLVVIGIMGLLAAILIPAVQAAREASRIMTCRNNTKQIGLAFQQGRNQSRRFPGPTEDPTALVLPWTVEILPFLDQTALYRQFLLDAPIDTLPNSELGGVRLAVYLCSKATDQSIQPWNWSPGHYALNASLAGKRLVNDGESQTIGAFEYGGDVAGWINSPNFYPAAVDAEMSRHSRLVILMADGSVRLVSKSISQEVLSAISTANGGEVVAGNF